ncbi:MAG: serine/threonine protein kinase, partial [Myxococcales bacterium]|nr:serine/threonine protein kinase [Myxococcales bacterium]
MLGPGDRIGRYTIEAPLGRGAMGAVFRAHDSLMRRPVALKVLGGEASSPTNPESRARFFREARTAGALQHPNVVSIFDVGEAEGHLYLAMELVDGTSLRALVGDAQVSLGVRIRWMIDVARALGAAHRMGLVHRDVKPENILVSREGVTKLADFGVVKVAIEHAPMSFRTKTGQLLGTPDYMAPEQWHGADVDARADQYAWGLVTYELLTGKPVPLGKAPPLGAVAPDVPDVLRAAVDRALEHDRARRFASMDELLAAVEGRASLPPSGPMSPRVLDAIAAVENIASAPTVSAPPPALSAPP